MALQARPPTLHSSLKGKQQMTKPPPVLIIRPLFHFADGSGRVASAADGLFWAAQAHQVTRSIWSADDTDDGRIKLHTEGAMRKSLGEAGGKRSMDTYGDQYFDLPKQAV